MTWIFEQGRASTVLDVTAVREVELVVMTVWNNVTWKSSAPCCNQIPVIVNSVFKGQMLFLPPSNSKSVVMKADTVTNKLWLCRVLPHPTKGLSLRFNGHFPGGPGLAGTRMSPFCILLKQDDGGGGDNWSYKTCKAPYRHHQKPTPSFFTGRMRFLLPNQQCQSTVSHPTKGLSKLNF